MGTESHEHGETQHERVPWERDMMSLNNVPTLQSVTVITYAGQGWVGISQSVHENADKRGLIALRKGAVKKNQKKTVGLLRAYVFHIDHANTGKSSREVILIVVSGVVSIGR